MKLVFGRVPAEHDATDTFVGKSLNGTQANFYYRLDINEEDEEFRIIDTCGRFMPMDFDSLDELVNILKTLQEFRSDKADFIQHWKTQFGQP